MYEAAIALERLAECCGIRKSPRPLMVCGGSGKEVAYHTLSTVVLHSILVELFPTAVALQIEASLAESKLLRVDRTASLSTAPTPLPIDSGRRRCISVDPSDHVALMVHSRGNPFAKMLMQCAIDQSANHSGGGWTHLYLASNTLRRLLWVSEDVGSSRNSVSAQVAVLAGWVNDLFGGDQSIQVLAAAGVVRKVSTPNALRSFVSDQLRMHGWFEDEEEHCMASRNATDELSRQIVECIGLCATATEVGESLLQPSRVQFRCLATSERISFISTANDMSGGGSSPPSHQGCRCTEVLLGMMLPWQLSLENQLLLGAMDTSSLPIRVLLFTEPIQDEDLALLLKHVALMRTVIEQEMNQQGGAFSLMIVCQKTISLLVQSVMFCERVLTLERLSLRFVEPLCRTTGCRALHSPSALSAGIDVRKVLGQLQRVCVGQQHESIGGRYRTFLLGTPGICTLHTVVLFHSNPARHSLIEERARHAFVGVCQLFSKGALVVEGAGGWERFLAYYILYRRRLTPSSAGVGTKACSGVIAQEVAESLRSLQTKFDAPSKLEDHDAVYQQAALQLAALYARQPVSGCPLPPSACGTMNVHQWSGLPPISESMCIEFFKSRPIAEPLWTHVDSLWSKRALSTDYLNVLHTILSVARCQIDM